MRHLFLRSLIVPFLLTLLALGQGAVSPVLGAACGEGVGPCSCEDTVVTSTKLNRSDPVLSTPCSCIGLRVASGVTLHIGGTIQQAHDPDCFGVGIISVGTNVVVKIGRIVGFRYCVSAAVTESQFSRLQTDCWDTGIVLAGTSNLVESNFMPNSSIGIDLIGDHNAVSRNRIEGGNWAIAAVGGSGNLISRNVFLGSDAAGLLLSGDTATVDGYRSLGSGVGFEIAGEKHTVTRNVANDSLSDGFVVSATSSAFTGNRSGFNGAFGMADSTTGDGTGGTANTYTANRCTRNGLDDSSPPELCF